MIVLLAEDVPHPRGRPDDGTSNDADPRGDGVDHGGVELAFICKGAALEALDLFDALLINVVLADPHCTPPARSRPVAGNADASGSPSWLA